MNEMGEYKPGVRWVRGSNGEYYLEQNPDASSIFAAAKRAGMDIVWILSDKPQPGHTIYTGELFVNGERLSKWNAERAIQNWFARKRPKVAYA